MEIKLKIYWIIGKVKFGEIGKYWGK